MGDPRGGRPGDDVATANRVRLRRLRRLWIRRIRLPPELEDALAVEDHEQLLVGAVAVRRRAFLAGRKRDPVEAGPWCARLPRRMLGDAAVVTLEIVEVDDRWRARGWLGPLELGLARVRM